MISKTLRLTSTRATVIKSAIENYEEIAKLNLSNDEYIELLTVLSECDKVIGNYKTQVSKEGVNR